MAKGNVNRERSSTRSRELMDLVRLAEENDEVARIVDANEWWNEAQDAVRAFHEQLDQIKKLLAGKRGPVLSADESGKIVVRLQRWIAFKQRGLLRAVVFHILPGRFLKSSRGYPEKGRADREIKALN